MQLVRICWVLAVVLKSASSLSVHFSSNAGSSLDIGLQLPDENIAENYLSNVDLLVHIGPLQDESRELLNITKYGILNLEESGIDGLTAEGSKMCSSARSRYTCTIEGVLIVGVEAAALLEIADTNSFLDDAFINDRSSFRFCVFSDSVVIGNSALNTLFEKCKQYGALIVHGGDSDTAEYRRSKPVVLFNPDTNSPVVVLQEAEEIGYRKSRCEGVTKVLSTLIGGKNSNKCEKMIPEVYEMSHLQCSIDLPTNREQEYHFGGISCSYQQDDGNATMQCGLVEMQITRTGQNINNLKTQVVKAQEDSWIERFPCNIGAIVPGTGDSDGDSKLSLPTTRFDKTFLIGVPIGAVLFIALLYMISKHINSRKLPPNIDGLKVQVNNASFHSQVPQMTQVPQMPQVPANRGMVQSMRNTMQSMRFWKPSGIGNVDDII